MGSQATQTTSEATTHRTPTATLRVELPAGTWIHDVSCAHPEATFRVVAALPTAETGVGLVEIRTTEMPAVLGAIEDHDGVTALELLEAGETKALVQFETTQPLLLLSVRNSKVPLELPVTIEEGTASVEVNAGRSQLRGLVEQFERFGLSFEVSSAGGSATRSLTRRQREALVAAVERGYYETPRDCTLTELAEELGFAKSTLSVRLNRAEAKVVEAFVEGLPPLSTVDRDRNRERDQDP